MRAPAKRFGRPTLRTATACPGRRQPPPRRARGPARRWRAVPGRAMVFSTGVPRPSDRLPAPAPLSGGAMRHPRPPASPAAVRAAAGLLITLAAASPAFAYTPQNRPVNVPVTYSSDGPELRPAQALLGRWRRLGPIGGPRPLARANATRAGSRAASGYT